MSKKDEALKLALEALDLAKRSHGVMLLSDPPQEAWKAYRVDDTLRNAITAIREALAEQPPCKYPHCPYPCPDLPDCRDAEQPAIKPWVGLTDEEFQWIYDSGRTPAGMMELAEAKLREKNA